MPGGDDALMVDVCEAIVEVEGRAEARKGTTVFSMRGVPRVDALKPVNNLLGRMTISVKVGCKRRDGEVDEPTEHTMDKEEWRA